MWESKTLQILYFRNGCSIWRYRFRVCANPFASATTITYSLTQTSIVEIKIYDVEGKLITQVLNEKQLAGKHNAVVNAEGLSKGLYLLKLSINNNEFIQKLNVIK